MYQHRMALACSVLPIVAAGCAAPQAEPLEPLALPQAIAIVNANAARIHGTLRASGNVDGQITQENGRRRSFNADGVLLFHEPHYVRFDLKKLGERHLLVGSNATHYWQYEKEDDKFTCGRHGDDAASSRPSVRPDQLPAALGLTAIPTSTAGAESMQRQRVTKDSQVVFVAARDGSGRLYTEREYWLDRRAPRLIRRVLFRNSAGQIELDARLDRYKRMPESGAFLPTVLSAYWPRSDARLRFQVNKWTLHPDVSPNGPQFATPPDCASGDQSRP